MRFRYFLVGAGLLVLSALLLVSSSGSASAAPTLVAAFGKANVGGQELIVHIVSVVPAGHSARDVANASLAAQGARPLTSSEFTTTGLVWTDGGPADATANDGVAEPIFNYNPAGDPFNGLSQGEVEGSLAGWNGITSNFAFEYGGHTNRCPSLVRECSGPQTADQNNDIGWILIKERNTLAVTWFNTGSKEADIAFSTRHAWFIDGISNGDFDIRTVGLHELGHGLGLGHSSFSGAVMEPYYGGVIQTPQPDDIAGVLAIYEPTATPPDPTPTPTPVPGGEITDLVSGGVVYSLSGKKGRDLIIEVAAEDDSGLTVAGADVSITVYLDGTLFGTGGPSATGTDGTVRWRVRNAASGTWTTTVEAIDKGGISCSSCPDNSDAGFLKP